MKYQWRLRGWPDGLRPLPGVDFDSQKFAGRNWKKLEKSMRDDLLQMEKWSPGIDFESPFPCSWLNLNFCIEEREMQSSSALFGQIPLIVSDTGKVLAQVFDVRMDLQPDTIHMDVESLDAANEIKQATETVAIHSLPDTPQEPTHAVPRKTSRPPYKIVDEKHQPNTLYRMPAHTPEIELVELVEEVNQHVRSKDQDVGEQEETFLDESLGFDEEEEDFYHPWVRPTIARDGYQYRSQSGRAEPPPRKHVAVAKPHHRVSARPVPVDMFYNAPRAPPSSRPLPVSRALSIQPPVTRMLPRGDVGSRALSRPYALVPEHRAHVRKPQNMGEIRAEGQVQEPIRYHRQQVHDRVAPQGGRRTHPQHLDMDTTHSGAYNAVAGPSRMGEEMMQWVPKRQQGGKKQSRY